MNNRTNSLFRTRTGFRHHTDTPYDDGLLNRIHVSSMSLAPCSTYGVMSSMGPFGSRAYAPSPYTLARVTSQPPMQNLTRDTNIRRDAPPRPRFTSQLSMVDDPLIMQGNQNKGFEKLRREIYSPGVPRLNLYYRDYYSRPKSQEKGNNEDGKRCAVCLDDFEPREMVTLTPCNHMFHENCIVPWVKSHGQCPVCD